MKSTKPSVKLVAYTTVNYNQLQEFLDEEGALKYQFAGELGPMEELIRTAGKACYRSYEPELNKNVSKTTAGGKEYIANILRQAHGSVLEHASMTFAICGVSRVFTHELVRHRAGTAFSQESLRYVRGDDVGFWKPTELREPGASHEVDEIVKSIEESYRRLEQLTGVDREDMPFSEKKKITSALRRILPQGMSTTIFFTANIRALRHTILMRTMLAAEEEIRAVFDEIARLAKGAAPALFSDFSRRDDGAWTCKNVAQPYEDRSGA